MDAPVKSIGHVLLVGPADPPGQISVHLQQQGWNVSCVRSPSHGLRFLRSNPTIDLVAVIPDSDISESVEMCRAIKFDKRTSFISVVFLVGPACADAAADILESGADDCILLSAPAREILMRISRAIRIKQATDSLEDAAAVILALANAVEGKDPYTCGHVERVASYCVQIGREIGRDQAALSALHTGGIVHDIGKIGIPDQILNKPGKLTDDEMAIMKRHPMIGHDILKPLRTFRDVLPIVRWHHEMPNGQGYPDGLKGNDIPLTARIAAVADVFDALATDRPYRKAFPVEKCQQIMHEMAEAGKLDPHLVQVLFKILQQGLSLPANAQAA